MGTFTVTTPGDGTFVAAATTVVFEMWGGHGLPSLYTGAKGGAGGGARTKKTVTGLTIGQTYNYHVGDEGEDTWCIDATTGKAVCGGNPGGAGRNTDRTGGTGGAAASCIGDPGESFSGGNGGIGGATVKGGGGGSSAGSAANGVPGSAGNPSVPGPGGVAPTGGGNGGAGGNTGLPGAAGSTPGGAPGGGSSGQPSGTKSAGKIIATWVDQQIEDFPAGELE